LNAYFLEISCFKPLFSNMEMKMNVQKMKDVFVGNFLLYKNLSQVFHNYHGLRYSKGSLDPIFHYFVRKKLMGSY